MPRYCNNVERGLGDSYQTVPIETAEQSALSVCKPVYQSSIAPPPVLPHTGQNLEGNREGKRMTHTANALAQWANTDLCHAGDLGSNLTHPQWLSKDEIGRHCYNTSISTAQCGDNSPSAARNS